MPRTKKKLFSDRTTRLLAGRGLSGYTPKDFAKMSFFELKILLQEDARSVSEIAEVVAEKGLTFADPGHPILAHNVGKKIADYCYSLGITRFEQLADLDISTAKRILPDKMVEYMSQCLHELGMQFKLPGKQTEFVTLVRVFGSQGGINGEIPVCQMPREQAKLFCEKENAQFDNNYGNRFYYYQIQDLPVFENDPNHVKKIAETLEKLHLR